jgi:DNA helicase-2/ATP-dependent DNA helicase PcrA
VRTLHGLSHDIVRERPDLVGLSDGFQIVDERAADQIRQEAAEAWLRGNTEEALSLVHPDIKEGRLDWVRRSQLPRLVSDVALSFIRQAKDLQLTPGDIRQLLDSREEELALAEMGLAIYADYQRALAYRGAVDFDDLIRLALRALELDEEYLARLRHRWPYILEDEAQDSSVLQEKILRTLAGPHGNWVRVGDPNQAIYETFTTASPRFLRDFLREDDVVAREMPNSGRSSEGIIKLANYLIDWTRGEHPREEIREALALPHIEPSPPGDPQPNPRYIPGQIHLIDEPYTPAEELRAVADSLARWLPEHRDRTVAVLVPRNERGFELVSELKRRNLEYVELLRSSRSTRETAGALGNLARYLADPSASQKLATVYRVWLRDVREDAEANAEVQRLARTVRRCRQVEDYLWPRAERDWLSELDLSEEPEGTLGSLERFRELVRRWQEATVLPIDQLILTLAQDLFEDPADLAVAHKLALVLRRANELHPGWRLPELTQELGVVARNERRFLGLSGDDIGFEPERHKGQVVVSTIHKAKGLEWDRVYLMSVNSYNFPSAGEGDSFISERWFVRDEMNVEAEALAQLEALVKNRAYREGEARLQARFDYAAERLRLLFVGITRAKEELIVTWNTGRRGDQRPAAPLIALEEFWKREENAFAG